MKTRATVALFLITAYSLFADSLWDPDSTGLLTEAGDLKTGDIILISINFNQDLTYSSSRIDSERVSIELSGGEGQDLFSFLPSGGSSGNQSLSGSSSLALETSFAVKAMYWTGFISALLLQLILSTDGNANASALTYSFASRNGPAEQVALTDFADANDCQVTFSEGLGENNTVTVFVSVKVHLFGSLEGPS